MQCSRQEFNKICCTGSCFVETYSIHNSINCDLFAKTHLLFEVNRKKESHEIPIIVITCYNLMWEFLCKNVNTDFTSSRMYNYNMKVRNYVYVLLQ